jgi:hypothetical protein
MDPHMVVREVLQKTGKKTLAELFERDSTTRQTDKTNREGELWKGNYEVQAHRGGSGFGWSAATGGCRDGDAVVRYYKYGSV